MSKVIKLSYSCTKNWDSLDESSKGKYCTSCEKDVIDLSMLGYDELSTQLAGLGKGACVKIPEAYAEQEELDGIELTIPQGLKRLALAASLVGATLALPAQTKEPVKIEAASILNADEVKQNQAPSTPEVIPQANTSASLESPKTPLPYKRKRRLYANSRFPFIHYKRPTRTVGRVMGCPSF